MTPQASSMSTRVRSRVCRRSSSRAKRGGVGPDEAHRAVAVPRLQREVLGGGLGVGPGDLEDALAAHADDVAARAPSSRTGMATAHTPLVAAADGLELPLGEQVA